MQEIVQQLDEEMEVLEKAEKRIEEILEEVRGDKK